MPIRRGSWQPREASISIEEGRNLDLGHDLTQAIAYAADYAGELSFGRRRYTRDLHGVDIVVVGIPFDAGTVNRPGARFGPRAIREQTSLVGCYPWGIYPWDFNVFERCEVVDYSDIAAVAGYPDRMVAAVRDEVGSILETGASVLSLGGDHMVTYPLLEAHAAVHGPLSLVHFDAHSDTWGMGDDLNHGTWGYLAAQRRLVDPERSIQLGMRSPNPDTLGFTVVDANPLLAAPVEASAERIREVVGDAPVYLTLDIDFLDPAFAPGTGTPVCGGPNTQQARALLHALAGINLVGADVVEVAPPYDPAGVTALAGATLSYDLLSLLALGRERRQERNQQNG
jgi:agmatinase